jgi:thymidylate synthase (FAD)
MKGKESEVKNYRIHLLDTGYVQLIRWKGMDKLTADKDIELFYDIQAPFYLMNYWMYLYRNWTFTEPMENQVTLQFYVPSREALGGQYVPFNPAAVQNIMRDHVMVSRKTYEQLREMGLRVEIARTMLPLASYTRMLGGIDLRSFFLFARQQAHPLARYESREYAEAMLQLAKHVFPETVGKVVDATWKTAEYVPNLNRPVE